MPLLRPFIPILSTPKRAARVITKILCYFAAYIPLFLLGIHAGEKKWLEKLAEKSGMRRFSIDLGAGIPLWGIIMIAGGLYWQSFAFVFWESFVAICFSIGLIAFFRKWPV